MGRGRPLNQDRQNAIALGLPTYIGHVHPICGTAERLISGACVACRAAAHERAVATRLANAERKALRKAQRVAKPRRGRRCSEARQQAITLDLKSYMGRPHRQCGTSERYTRNGSCIHCARERGLQKHYQLRRERDLARLNEPVIERQVAADAGPRPTRFFTGRPCCHGHIAERLVSTGGCVECQTLRANLRRRTREYKDRTNAKLAAERAARRTPRPCAICETDFVPRIISVRACSPMCAKELYRRNHAERMVSGPKPRKQHLSMRQWRVEQQKRKKQAVPLTVDADALAAARAAVKQIRDTRKLINPGPWQMRSKRANARYANRRDAALAVAAEMIPVTLKQAQTYREKVKLSFDFLRSIQPEKPHDTV